MNDNWTYTADLAPFVRRSQDGVEAHKEKTLLVFYGIDTIANIVGDIFIAHRSSLLTVIKTVAGHPVAWVNNQFRQYVFDISDILPSTSSSQHDTNLTVAFESAYHYGLNVTSRPDAEISPTGDVSPLPLRS